MPHDIQTKLAAPFEDTDIEWRLQWTDDEKGSGIAVPYVTNRAIQNRLDKIAGSFGWKNEYIPWHSDGKKASQLCGISIYCEERKEWITKYDGAEDSDIEPVKGGISDSMKRAAVQWGIGRYLYSMDTVFVDTEKRGKTTVIKKSSQGKLNEAHQRAVSKIAGEPPMNTKPDAASTPLPVSKVTPITQTSSVTPFVTPSALAQQKPVLLPQPAAVKSEIPKDIYHVLSIAIQQGINGQNTLLQLRDTDGNTIMAYMQGVNPAIVSNVLLENAVITKKVKEGIAFYTLDSYEIAASQAA